MLEAAYGASRPSSDREIEKGDGGCFFLFLLLHDGVSTAIARQRHRRRPPFLFLLLILLMLTLSLLLMLSLLVPMGTGWRRSNFLPFKPI